MAAGARALAALGDDRLVTVDLVVVGAGINGAGIARDAALRGLSVALVDKGDVASGTTSWSTRLIHGGLRYLEHAEVGLVRESLRERERLLRIAPHLVSALSFLVPVYDDDRRGRTTIRAGMLAYDALSGDGSLGRHAMLSATEALAREPGLDPVGLRGAAVYSDAQAEFPERLALENVLAAGEAGADVRLHTRVDSLLREEGRVRGVRVGGGEIRAALTVNVAGPWVDEVLGGAEQRPLVGGTKGTHLVLAPFAGAPDEALYVEAADGRPYFIVPWNELLLIGTTDDPYDGDLDRVVATDGEIDYLLAETNSVIPGAGLGRDDVLYTYAGVRPLPFVPEGEAGGVTRRHVIEDHAPELEGIVSVIGGKLTTYRELAEQVVDVALLKLALEQRPATTGEEPLPGARGDLGAVRRELAAGAGCDDRAARRLVRIYGVRAREVVALADADRALAAPLDPATGALAAEVVWACEHERARTLADVLLRRTMVGLGPTVGVGPDAAAAAVARDHLGWSAARAAEEVEAYRAAIATMRPRTLRTAS